MKVFGYSCVATSGVLLVFTLWQMAGLAIGQFEDAMTGLATALSQLV